MKTISFLTLFLSLVGCIPLDTKEKIKELPAMPEMAIWNQGRHKIAVIPVEGVLMMAQGETGNAFVPSKPDIVKQTTRFLRHAAYDSEVKAAVMIVDSPGGGVTESALIREEVLRFKAQKKPLVVWQRRVAASGGYYISAPADHIVAHPTSITGSIGVITVLPNFAGLMDKLGIEAHTIKSGKMKDSGSAVRAMTSEDKKYFQTLIDSMYKQFLEIILEGRPGLTEETLRPLADGRVFSAEDALEYGLVDSLGSLEDALNKAQRLAGLNKYQTKAIGYDLVKPGLQVTLTRVEAQNPGMDISLRFPEPLAAGLWYLWRP